MSRRRQHEPSIINTQLRALAETPAIFPPVCVAFLLPALPSDALDLQTSAFPTEALRGTAQPTAHE